MSWTFIALCTGALLLSAWALIDCLRSKIIPKGHRIFLLILIPLATIPSTISTFYNPAFFSPVAIASGAFAYFLTKRNIEAVHSDRHDRYHR